MTVMIVLVLISFYYLMKQHNISSIVQYIQSYNGNNVTDTLNILTIS